jgi:cyclophilin family peptidyl-prolyl cis-trans isomerase
MTAETRGETPKYHIQVYGKYQDPVFQSYKKAAESLTNDRTDVISTVEGMFESQYEQKLRYFIDLYGGSFLQAKPSSALIFAETDDDQVLYFLNEKRFFDWALKRFKYEDNTRLIFYKRIGVKTLQNMRATSGRSYCALGISIGGDPAETVHFELFDEECPVLVRNFLDLLQDPKFEGHPVHRIKSGAWVQAGDLKDGSGLNSEAASGGFLRHESFRIRHDRGGLLGMANQGKDTNGSQFYITVKELPFLDGKSVIIGRVIGGMRTILKVSKTKTQNERPIQSVKVCAQKEFTQVAGEAPKE